MRMDDATVVGQVFAQVLERLAFMIAEPENVEDTPPLQTSALRIDIGFSGPRTGILTLIVPVEVAAVVASNILGMEPGDELPPTGAEDACKELANVVCGQYLTALVGEEPVFYMTVPQAVSIDKSAWDAFLGQPQTESFQIDYEYPVLLKAVAE